MIVFDCPECGAENEASDRKAGKRVYCTRCDERIAVPDRRPKKRDDEPRRAPPVQDYLSTPEIIIYGVLFALAPGLNVIISSTLYFVWDSELPSKAYQINQLAWIILGLQVLPLCLCCCLGAGLTPMDGRRRR